MICHNCGKIMENGTRFCRYCGVRLVKEPAPQEEPQTDQKPEPGYRPEPRPAQQVNFAAAAAAEVILPERTMGAPVIQLPTRRSLVKMIFLSLITLGIYGVVIWCRISGEMNIVASRHDGKRTIHYLGMNSLTALTLGIYYYVWNHGLCRRLGDELQRRNLSYSFGPKHFWLWKVLGSLILVGPFIFIHKLMKAMNEVNRDFNLHG